MAAGREQVGELYAKFVVESNRAIAEMKAMQAEFRKTAAEATKTDAEVKKVGKGIGSLGGLMSKVMWPVGLLLGTMRVAQGIDNLIHLTHDLKKEMNDIGENFGRGITSRLLRNRGDFNRQQIALAAETARALEEVDRKANEQMRGNMGYNMIYKKQIMAEAEATKQRIISDSTALQKSLKASADEAAAQDIKDNKEKSEREAADRLEANKKANAQLSDLLLPQEQRRLSELQRMQADNAKAMQTTTSLIDYELYLRRSELLQRLIEEEQKGIEENAKKKRDEDRKTANEKKAAIMSESAAIRRERDRLNFDQVRGLNANTNGVRQLLRRMVMNRQ